VSACLTRVEELWSLTAAGRVERVASFMLTTDSAFLMALFSLLAFLSKMPAPQPTTAKKMVLATTDW